MDLTTEVKGKLMEYSCYDTSVVDIGNGFVEFLWTARKSPLVLFDDDHSKTSIPIGAAATDINLPNGTIIDHLNKTLILYGGSNSLLSTSQAREFSIFVHDGISIMVANSISVLTTESFL